MSAGRPTPSPPRRIPVAKPSFDEREERLLIETLRSGWVTQGPRVAEFERAFAARVGAAEAVAVSNGTTALFLALHALGIGPGDEVIVPSLSFIATANAVVHCGATSSRWRLRDSSLSSMQKRAWKRGPATAAGGWVATAS